MDQAPLDWSVCTGEDDTAMKTAFVFAGGSSLGAIQVGMLKSLVAHGWTADFVVGSSVGAINATQFACDPTPDGVARLEGVWRTLRRAAVFPITPLRGLLRLFLEHGYIVESRGLEQLLERNLVVRRLEETRLPCHIITTDLLEGTEIVQSRGPTIEALLASAAIPGVFPARRIDGRYVVDGGVANHTPLSAAVELGATRLVVLPTGYSCTLSEPPRSAIGIALHGLNLLIARQLVAAIRHYGQQVEVVVVPPLCPLGVSPYDFDSAAQLIDRAQASTDDWLAHGVELIDGVPHQLPLHSHRYSG
ncbi:MAG TPA: patatin-like phospholipase family protein [Steroidobacteraceae bacterium]